MNEQVQQIIMAVGALSELWAVTYKNFISQGFNHKESLEHTGAFMKVLIASIVGQKGD